MCSSGGAFAKNLDHLHGRGISENKFRPAKGNGSKAYRGGVEKVVAGAAKWHFYNKNSNGTGRNEYVIGDIRRHKKRKDKSGYYGREIEREFFFEHNASDKCENRAGNSADYSENKASCAVIEKAHQIDGKKRHDNVSHHGDDGFALTNVGGVLEHQFFFHLTPSFLASSICFFALMMVAATSILAGQT